MKRLLLGSLIVGGATLLGGCPIYPDGRSSRDCVTATDCGAGYACTSDGFCVPYRSDGYYDASTSGDCNYCPVGTVCTLAGGVLQCLSSSGSGVDASTGTDDAASAVDASFAIDASHDASGVSEAGSGGAVCNADEHCASTPGSKCIDGLCTVQGHLCSDGTQCLVPGDACVDGVCLSPCGGGSPPCPAGYACDFNRGVCSVNPSPCSSSHDCQGGAVCVENRCVAPCSPADAGTQCAAAQVCVNGGCIPDEQARFPTCQNEGNEGALAYACDPTSICLHGDCYPACGSDGGGCATPGESCKSVTISKGTYFVCGGATNLGSECNPGVGSYCGSPKVCINGYCK